MRAFFQKLHDKSPQTRARIALSAAALITAIIALLWLAALPNRLATVTKQGEELQERNAAAAISAFGSEVKGTYNAIEGLQIISESQLGQTQ